MVNFNKYDANKEVDHEQLRMYLGSRNTAVVGVSGKKGSGKDTFGRGMRQHMVEKFGMTVDNLAFADALKSEATEIMARAYTINHCGSTPGREAGLTALVEDFNLPPNSASVITEHLRNEPKDSSGWSRTEGAWWTLRYLGTTIRQSQDQIYWVKKTFPLLAQNTINGVSTIFTDVRFLHEAEFIHDMGGYLLRIDVSPETQARRLMKRDNLSSTPETLNHPSEVQLDDYEGFHLRVNNDVDGGIVETLVHTCAHWETWMHKNQLDGRFC